MLGLIGKKVGMTQIFNEEGELIPVTVIKVEDNVVIANKTTEKDGYNAAVVASMETKKNLVTKPYKGQFKDGIEPKKVIKEMRDFDKEVQVGELLPITLLNDCSYVDVTGTSKGKGFQGGMKRYGFGGGRKTHGSKFHRDLGGTAMSSTPSHTFKGRHMAGHMGDETVTVQNLRLVGLDSELNVLMVKGAIPGPSNGTVLVKKAVKR